MNVLNNKILILIGIMPVCLSNCSVIEKKFYFNDTVNSVSPSDVFIAKDYMNTQRYKEEYIPVCDNLKKAPNLDNYFASYLFINLRFGIIPTAIKTIEIDFDEEFNKELKAD